MEWSPMILRSDQRQRLERAARSCMDARERTRRLIVLHSAAGWSIGEIAKALKCGPRTVSRVRRRWRAEGEAGLIDRREDNGERKLDEVYLWMLRRVLRGTSRAHGHRRPTWTQRLLIQTMARRTGVVISRASMSRALKMIGARWGRPKPTVGHLGWSTSRKNRRLALIRQLIQTLPANQAAVWEDEVDLDLNPRIGNDWMLPGTQRQVVTPGKNIKRYFAGALDAHSRRLIWIKGQRKDSGLFITLLSALLRRYPDTRMIHVILDNYCIHFSRRVQAWLTERGARIRLHFLPPYCPDDNEIERTVWRELHQNVTYNHSCQSIAALEGEADDFLHQLDRRLRSEHLSQLRKAI